jgi:Ferritin-like
MIRLRPDVSGLLQARNGSAVASALQAAIELEHATIPPYLYALYSLGSGTNSAVADIIQSVVRDEMLHLTLVANILNGLGGSPVFDSPSLIPHYPGPLPGSVEGELVVSLAPCSLDLVKSTFMVIEQPEHPLEFPAEAMTPAEPVTIGQFYRTIRATIVELGDGAFSRQPRNQVTTSLMNDIVVVTDVATACHAIDTIIDQGEGTATTPGEIVGTDYAHYYRFAEIANGRRLIRNPAAGPSTPPDQQYIYGGDPVTFDAAQIFAVPANPTTATYPDGSPARKACVTFNYTYTSLLKCLHATFNGEPGELKAAVGIMMSLRQQAIDMMAGTTTAGTPAGPTFEWQAVNS